jgi:hypothetical protein
MKGKVECTMVIHKEELHQIVVSVTARVYVYDRMSRSFYFFRKIT